MIKPKGKLIAILAGLGVGLLGLSVYVLRDAIRERYYIHKLQSPDVVARTAALDRLVELASVNAVPAIVRMRVRGKEPSYDRLLEIALKKKPAFVQSLRGMIRSEGIGRAARCFATRMLDGGVEIDLGGWPCTTW